MSFASDSQRKWFFANLGSGGSDLPAEPRDVDIDAGQARRDARISYAQAMYPHLSAPDALRLLNDRNG